MDPPTGRRASGISRIADAPEECFEGDANSKHCPACQQEEAEVLEEERHDPSRVLW